MNRYCVIGRAESYGMATKENDWRVWGTRLRVHMKEHRIRPVTLAAKFGISEPAMRSWINGNRQINLSDFFTLCVAAKADPRQILFGGMGLSLEQKQALGQAVVSILEADTAAAPGYPELVKQLQQDINLRRSRNK